MADDRFQIAPLARHHDRAAFTCGQTALDRYLRQQARQDASRHVAAVVVLADRTANAIAGYYTLASASIELTDLPPEVARRLPKYPTLPVALLGRLAVALGYQGQRLGEILLIDALRRAYQQSAEIAAMAVIVDAKDDRARAFYERYGFRRFVHHDDRLFREMHSLAEILPGI